MLFHTSAFLVFMVVVFFMYWALPHRFRWCWLLAASYYFYMSWSKKLILLIVAVTLVTWAAALAIEHATVPKRKRLYLGAALLFCLGLLGVFKYFNFFVESFCQLLQACGLRFAYRPVSLILPVGISFYVFQAVGYVTDVYRGKLRAERHLGIYALFITFFPQLVAGPIERAKDLLGQLKSEKRFRYEDGVYGLKWMAWGLFKKVVVADLLAGYVDIVFGNVKEYAGGAFILATFFFAVQIYCDFSGYSDMALGSARLLGISLTQNFRSPYFATSVKEFWSRWHITLSQWFRDYVYIPLGGNRVGFLKHCRNLLITFTLSGLWHGANWTFVVWGMLHGLLQIVENIGKRAGTGRRRREGALFRLGKRLGVFITVCFAWAFFRADSLYDALWGLWHCLQGIGRPVEYLGKAVRGGFGFPAGYIYRIPIALACMWGFDWYQYRSGKDPVEEIGRLPGALRWGIYYGLLFMIAAWGVFGSNAFLYFQF